METLQPVYARTEGLSNNIISKAIRQAFCDLPLTYEFLPETIRKKHGICEYNYAVRQIHFPDSKEALITARKRLVFDEFFLFILNIRLQKEKRAQIANDFPIQTETVIPYLLSHLPYSLTRAQKKCLDEVVSDLKRCSVWYRGTSVPARRLWLFCVWR